MQSTVHSSTDCERISDLSVNITHVIPCSPGVCPPQARHRRRWVSSPPYRRAAGAAGQVNPSEVSPPETSLEPAAGAAGGQPAAGAGVSPFFPTKGVTRLVGKYPRGKNILYPRSTILLACIHRLTLVQMTHGTRVDTV